MVALVTAPLGGAAGVWLNNRNTARLAGQSMKSQQQKDDSTALARGFEALTAFVTAEMASLKEQLIHLQAELSTERSARHEAEKRQITAEGERKALNVENEALKTQASLLQGSVTRLTEENTHLREKVAGLETDLKHLRFELSGDVVGQRIMPPSFTPESSTT
jgi:predicted  nucleic acid-binding Zn-ribbon protein